MSNIFWDIGILVGYRTYGAPGTNTYKPTRTDTYTHIHSNTHTFTQMKNTFNMKIHKQRDTCTHLRYKHSYSNSIVHTHKTNTLHIYWNISM